MSAPTYLTPWPSAAARVEPADLAPGGHGRIVVTVDIPDGYHVQSNRPGDPFLIPTTLRLDETGDLALGAPVYPDGETQRFDWTPAVLDVYRGTIEIAVPVEVGTGATPGVRTISGRVRYQGCSDSACLPPAELPVEAVLEVGVPRDPST